LQKFYNFLLTFMKFIDFQQWSNLRNGKHIQRVISLRTHFSKKQFIHPIHVLLFNHFIIWFKKTKQHTNISTLKWLAILKESDLHHQIL
jgi:hypothetical protein